MITDMPTMTGEDLIGELSTLIDAACKRGDSVSAIAERAGVQRELVSGIRNGTYGSVPSLARIQSVASALGFGVSLVRKKMS
jgi:transcriptional regulator with XRE-family HTH domain